MLITVDGQKYTDLDPQGRTVGDVLNRIRESLTGSGKMIVSILCDGQAISPEAIESALGDPVEKYLQIDFQTAEPTELARNSLDACLDLLADIEQSCGEVVGLLQQAHVQDAMGKMNDLFFKLQSAYQGLDGTFKLMKIDPESVEMSAGNAKKFREDLKCNLHEIKTALESRDYVSLADLFQYELTPAVRQWQDLIRQILDALSTEQ